MTDGKLFIGGRWKAGSGSAFTSLNPANGEVVWSGTEATIAEVDEAVAAARRAFGGWSRLTVDERGRYIERYRALLDERREELAEAISLDTGKPLWESATEVAAMIGKIAISRQAYDARTPTTATDIADGEAVLTHRPHGVLAVFGPYNFPAHLPNGHMVPALLAGNTVVFKPSKLTPLVAERAVRCWHDAGLPSGVVNMVQGTRKMGAALVGHDGIDGLLFTGSSSTGKFLHKQFGGQTEKILALEMGGNNPLIVWDAGDIETTALIVVLSAYITAGQRCSCARRLILPRGAEGDRVIDALKVLIPRLVIGPFDGGETPFMGPVISNSAADNLLEAQEKLGASGGLVIAEMRRLKDGLPFLTPGLMDVTAIAGRPDEEYFGPFLQVIRSTTFDDALDEANATQYGLSAGLISADRALYERFRQATRAGVVNWNRPLTGASSAAPFGGLGWSGNHRPGAYYAADYCAYPVASMISERAAMPPSPPPGIRAGRQE